MSLNESTIIDKIEVLNSGVIQVRECTLITRGDDVVATTFYRYILTPGQDVSDQPEKVKAIAAATWKDDVILAWQESQKDSGKLLAGDNNQ